MNGAVMATVARSGSTKLRAGVAEVLDDAEQVVPAAGVQAGGVVAEFVEDLVHLERGRDGLDQDGGADGALRDAEVVLGEDEDLVPEPGLEVALHLGQVVVRALAVDAAAAWRCGRSAGRSPPARPRWVRRRSAGGVRSCASRAGGPPRRPAGRRCGACIPCLRGRCSSGCPLRRRGGSGSSRSRWTRWGCWRPRGRRARPSRRSSGR